MTGSITEQERMGDEYLLSNLSFYRANISEMRQAVYDSDNDIRYTYGDLERRSNRLAAFLVRVLHLEKQDTIGFCSPNSVAHIDAYYASCKTGLIVTTYNFLLNSKELERMVCQENPRVVFYSVKYSTTIDALRNIDSSREFIAIDSNRRNGDNYCYADIMEYDAAGENISAAVDMEDVQMLLHTGGTTGMPKAAMISYRSLFYNSLSEILTFGLSNQDSIYVFLPFFHTAAWNVLTLPLLMAGGRVIISKYFDPENALDIIEKERPTVAIAVETIYKAMATHPHFINADFSSYRWMISGAAPITRDTMEKYWEKGVLLVNAYGMTEIGPSNLAPPVNDISIELIRRKWNSVGKPMFFNNVRIVDDAGRDVGQGERGELIWKGNLTFSGYWKNEAETQAICRDGWIYSGDIGYRDEEGYYHICGRRKNMFISGGENIFPLEIEEALHAHPHVESACVIGVSDERWGEVGKALVVMKPGAATTKRELEQYLLGEISKIKVPKYIRFIDAIPKNAVGKIDMRIVREEYGYPGE